MLQIDRQPQMSLYLDLRLQRTALLQLTHLPMYLCTAEEGCPLRSFTSCLYTLRMGFSDTDQTKLEFQLVINMTWCAKEFSLGQGYKVVLLSHSVIILKESFSHSDS